MSIYDQLRSPGAQNPAVEEALVEQEDGSYHIDLETDTVCEPCRIPLYPFSADESVYWQDDDGYVVETATKKGHAIRNMAVPMEHACVPDPETLDALYDRLVEVTAGQIGDGEMVVFGSMQTFHDHFHIIASDLDGDDIDGIPDYALYSVEDGEAQLEEYSITTDLGAVSLRP